jgi:short-subunit dehydrogenase
MMQGLRDLVPRHNITINALAPGFTETGMANDADMFEKLREAGVTVQGADDVALGALYFASNTSLNGETLAVIGGTYIELEKPMKSAFLGVIKDASSNSTRKAAGGDGAKLAQKYFDVPLL